MVNSQATSKKKKNKKTQSFVWVQLKKKATLENIHLCKRSNNRGTKKSLKVKFNYINNNIKCKWIK